jgi:uncharacterized protein YabE (DUF348 family)
LDPTCGRHGTAAAEKNGCIGGSDKVERVPVRGADAHVRGRGAVLAERGAELVREDGQVPALGVRVTTEDDVVARSRGREDLVLRGVSASIWA